MKRLITTVAFGLLLVGLPLSVQAAQPCVNGTTTYRPVQAAPAVVQAPRTYRSFSYQPDAAVVAPAPAMRNYYYGGGTRTFNRHQPAYMNAVNKSLGRVN
jgi:hypothetical protein